MFFERGISSSGGGGTLGDDISTQTPQRPPLDWDAIIRQGFAVGSQAINAFSGRTTGTQIGYNPTQGIFAIQQTQPNYDDRYAANPYASYTPEQLALRQQQGGGGGIGLDSAAGGIINFVANNPLLVGAVALGAFLLFREPPRSRR